MTYTLEELSRIIKPIAEKHKLPAVFVFGSYARGEATEDSDVDLLVDTEGTAITSLLKLGGLYNDLEEALDKRLDLMTVGGLEQEPCKRSQVLFRNIVNREKVQIYDRA